MNELENKNKFNVDLDDMWKEWGYSRKEKATDYLHRNFKYGIDYQYTNGVLPERGGKPRKICMLTENCAFRFAKKVNTKKAQDFKNDKLDQTAKVLEKIGAGASNLSGSQLAVLALNKLLDENKQLTETVQLQAPKVEVYNAFIESKNTLTMNEVAKTLGIGRNKLFEKLRQMGIFTRRLPFQKYIDAGYFKVRQAVNNGKSYSYARATSKGMEYLQKRLAA